MGKHIHILYIYICETVTDMIEFFLFKLMCIWKQIKYYSCQWAVVQLVSEFYRPLID